MPDSLREIGNAAFGDCRKLKSIEIPESVRMIGPQAFAGCASIQSLKLSEQLEKIEEYIDGIQDSETRLIFTKR